MDTRYYKLLKTVIKLISTQDIFAFHLENNSTQHDSWKPQNTDIEREAGYMAGGGEKRSVSIQPFLRRPGSKPLLLRREAYRQRDGSRNEGFMMLEMPFYTSGICSVNEETKKNVREIGMVY